MRPILVLCTVLAAVLIVVGLAFGGLLAAKMYSFAKEGLPLACMGPEYASPSAGHEQRVSVSGRLRLFPPGLECTFPAADGGDPIVTGPQPVFSVMGGSSAVLLASGLLLGVYTSRKREAGAR
ncbi:hypothetical protein [Herbiconiux liukaitaii]|uniref:hypothetical protein n=1 Tax=Herbiconiux liukaitaii TaxID=3342799 RepID=UPI0035B7B38C